MLFRLCNHFLQDLFFYFLALAVALFQLICKSMGFFRILTQQQLYSLSGRAKSSGSIDTGRQ